MEIPAQRSELKVVCGLVGNRNRIAAATAALVFSAVIAVWLVIWLSGTFNRAALDYPSVWLFSFIGAASVFFRLPNQVGICTAALIRSGAGLARRHLRLC